MIRPSDMDKLYTTILADKKYPQELNDNFWKWFGNSETVDDNGNPLIFHHGTKQRFNRFKSAYDDHLVYFAYNKKFTYEWSRNGYITNQQSDILYREKEKANETYNKNLWNRYSKKYGTEQWYDDNVTESKIDFENYLKLRDKHERKIEKRLDLQPRQMSVYIKAENIFKPERDYKLVIDDIIERHKEDDEETVIKYAKEGHWSYYEMTKGIISKIFDELGFDAIELEEVRGQGITTLAVRDNTFQIKSIYNNGEFSSYTNNIYK